MHMHTIKIDFAISIKNMKTCIVKVIEIGEKNHITENASGTD